MPYAKTPLFRLMTLTVVLTFFPSCIGIWNFLPTGMPAAEAEELEGTPPADRGTVDGVRVAAKTADAPNAGHAWPGAASAPIELARRTAEGAPASSGDSRVQLASKLPNVQDAIAVFLEASRGAAESTPLKAPLGPAEAVARVTSADALRDSGKYAEATLAYLDIVDTYRCTHEALTANQSFTDMAKNLWFTDADAAEAVFEDVNAQVPKWETLSAEGKYELITFYSLNAICAQAVGRTGTMLAGFEQGHLRTLQFLREHPNTSMAFVLVEDYYEFRKEHAAVYEAVSKLAPQWDTSLDAAARDLAEFAALPEQSLARMAANCILALHAAERLHDWGSAYAYCAQALAGVDTGIAQKALDDPYVYTWSKANIMCLTGMAYTWLGRYQDALDWLSQPAFDLYPWSDLELRHGIELARIRLNEYLHPQDFNSTADALMAFIKTHPGSPRLPEAFAQLGKVFVLAGDYPGAAAIYGQIVREYPKTDCAATAQQELDFLATYLLDSVQVVNLQGYEFAKAQEPQLCGPRALRKLLALEGIEATEQELAELTHADDTGVSMQALIDAAAAKGVQLTGVEVRKPADLAAPFIAHVNENHFVLVTDVSGEQVVVSDVAPEAAPMPLAQFTAMWNGKALVIGDGGSAAKLLEPAALRGAKGGSKGTYYKPTHPISCTSCSGCPCICAAPKSGTATSANSSPPTLFGFPPPGTVRSPSADTGIHAPGVNPIIYPSSTSLLISETDLKMDIRGPMDIPFTRVYLNQSGFENGRFQFPSAPYANVIGCGWTHNFHVQLQVWSDGTPTGATFWNALGSAISYSYVSTANGYDRYTSGPTQDVLLRNTTTGVWRWEYPGAATYVFSPKSTAALGGYARLESIEDAAGNAVTLEYDGAVGVGKLTKVTPPAGDARYLRFQYAGNLITKAELCNTSGTLSQVEYAYDASANLTRVTDANAASVTYGYDNDGGPLDARFITKITDRAGNETNLTWTFHGSNEHQAYKIDLDNADGLRTTYDRSLSTYVAVVTNLDGTTTLSKFVHTPLSGDLDKTQYKDFYYGDLTQYERCSYEYDANKRLTRMTGPGNIQMAAYTYTSNGSLSTATDQAGSVETYTYAAAGDYFPASQTAVDGTVSTYYYDSANRVTKVTHPSVAAAGVQVAYDAYGQVTSQTDPLGNVTTMAYDAFGNLTSTTDPNNSTTTMYYDDLGNVTRVTDPRGKDTYHYYAYTGCAGCGGGGGVLTKVRDALNNETEYRYDVNGRMTKVIDALDRETDYAYDVMGRMTQVTSPSGSGNSMYMVYDLLGQAITKQDFEGKNTLYAYDHMGRQTCVTDPVDAIVYSYDSLGNLSMMTDGLNHTTDYDYDGANRLTRVTDAIGKVTRYFYDSAGRSTKVGAGADGTIDPTEYFFNATTGRMTKTRYTSGANSYDANYFYDGAARLTKLTDWIDGTDGLRYAYDAGGRLTQLTDYDDSTLDYTYDAAGNVLTMNDYHNNDVTYTYTDTGQVSTVTAPGSKTWAFVYNALGQPTSVSIPNGMTTEYGYDSLNRVTSIAHKDGSTVLDGFTYALTVGGNITRTTHQDNAKWEYEYDGRERLTKAERYDTDGTTLMTRFSYSYDDADNMLSKVVYDARENPAVTTSTAFAYDAANELTSAVVGATTVNFGYDAWGRMTSKADGTYTATYAYRYGDKLYSVTSDFPSEANVTYEYGGDQKRRERTSGGTTTQYNWDLGWDVINEEDSAGTVTRTYVGRNTAHVDGSDPSTGIWRFYFHDHLGSSRGVFNADKTQYVAIEHTPYGEVYASSGTISDITRRYTGHEWEASAQTYCAPYRYYLPAVGRWLTRDAFGMVDGPNNYWYGSATPINTIDLLGDEADGSWHWWGRKPHGRVKIDKKCQGLSSLWLLRDTVDHPEWVLEPIEEGWGETDWLGYYSTDYLYLPSGTAIKVRGGNTCEIMCDCDGKPTHVKCWKHYGPLAPDPRGYDPSEDGYVPPHPVTGLPPRPPVRL